jgi:predicted nucleic acid-binding protein
MSDKFFVDTNILIYAHDRSAGQKHADAVALIEELWESGRGVLSMQVLQEFCVNMQRRVSPPLPQAELKNLIEDYEAWEVVTPTVNSVLQALDLQTRYRISFWDALIIQAAESAGASTLYSEDLAHNQLYGIVRVSNPFATSAI